MVGSLAQHWPSNLGLVGLAILSVGSGAAGAAAFAAAVVAAGDKVLSETEQCFFNLSLCHMHAAGQCCAVGSRLFVHAYIYDEFVNKSAERARKRTVRALGMLRCCTLFRYALRWCTLPGLQELPVTQALHRRFVQQAGRWLMRDSKPKDSNQKIQTKRFKPKDLQLQARPAWPSKLSALRAIWQLPRLPCASYMMIVDLHCASAPYIALVSLTIS